MCVKLCMIPEEFVSTRFLKYFSLLVLWTFSRDNTPRHLMRLNSSRISRYGPYIHSTWQQQQPANTLSFLSIDTQISGIDNLRALARLNQRIVFQITTCPKSKCASYVRVCARLLAFVWLQSRLWLMSPGKSRLLSTFDLIPRYQRHRSVSSRHCTTNSAGTLRACQPTRTSSTIKTHAL